MMYCVKCKNVTNTTDVENTVTQNGRNMKRGRCAVCEKTKTQFGGGVVNSLINNLPFEMHLPGHNFTGPGTKLNKRLNSNGTPKAWSMPVNRVDDAAYHHDVCYATNKDADTRNRVCDKSMIYDLRGIMNPTLRERLDRSIVEKIIGTKMNLGMGLLKKL